MGLGRPLSVSSGFSRPQWITTNVSGLCGSFQITVFVGASLQVWAGLNRCQQVNRSQRVLDNLGGSLRVAVGLCGSLRVSANFGGSRWVSADLRGSKRDSVGLRGSRWFSGGSVRSEFVIVRLPTNG